MYSKLADLGIPCLMRLIFSEFSGQYSHGKYNTTKSKFSSIQQGLFLQDLFLLLKQISMLKQNYKIYPSLMLWNWLFLNANKINAGEKF